MSEEKIYDITIIGGGPVGLWAAFYAGLRGMTVNIIESLSELGGQPAILYPEKKIYDIPAFPQTTGAELTENLLTQLKRFEDRVSIHLKEEVQTFEKTDGIFTITTSKGQHLSKAIVIACGNGAFAPRPLGVDNEEDYADNTAQVFKSSPLNNPEKTLIMRTTVSLQATFCPTTGPFD